MIPKRHCLVAFHFTLPLPALNPVSNAPPRRISFVGFVREGAAAVTEFTANLVRLFAEVTALNIEATASIALQMKFIHRGMQSWAMTLAPLCSRFHQRDGRNTRNNNFYRF
jgi:L-asparagine transporter-like permease